LPPPKPEKKARTRNADKGRGGVLERQAQTQGRGSGQQSADDGPVASPNFATAKAIRHAQGGPAQARAGPPAQNNWFTSKAYPASGQGGWRKAPPHLPHGKGQEFGINGKNQVPISDLFAAADPKSPYPPDSTCSIQLERVFTEDTTGLSKVVFKFHFRGHIKLLSRRAET